jgi:cytochrome c-type biogenesis protein
VTELTPIVAFAGGVVSFFAPCVAPVVPGYVTFIAGGPGASRTRRFVLTSAFILGFSAAFVALGLLIGAVGSSPMFQGFERWLQWVGGALIIAFGLAMTGLLRVPFLERDLRFHGKMPSWLGPGGGAFALGLAFGVGWSPCMGPILAGILLLAGVSGTAASGALLLVAFSLGLAVPFLLLGFSAERGAALVRRFARAARGIEVVGGGLLVLVGIAVFTGAIARLTSYVVG